MRGRAAVLKVNVDELDKVRGDLQKSAREIEHALERLEHDLRLLEHRWDGASSGAFTTVRARWAAHADVMRTSLDGIAALVEKTTTTYTDIERTNINTWA